MKKSNLYIPNCRIDGYKKVYEGPDSTEAAIVLDLVGEATDANLAILGAPGFSPHAKSWTSDRKADECKVSLCEPVPIGAKGAMGKAQFSIPAARISNIGGDHKAKTVRARLTITRGADNYAKWEAAFAHPWVGTLEVSPLGQGELFPEDDDGDDDAEALDGPRLV